MSKIFEKKEKNKILLGGEGGKSNVTLRCKLVLLGKKGL